ncbi:hypothetical protein JCM1840_000191, partial [Sporobolomyces johnsonii]
MSRFPYTGFRGYGTTSSNLVHHTEIYLSSTSTVPALHNTLLLVLDKLFFYYGKTSDCPYYVAAILLHPALGIWYMRARKWPQEWINDTSSQKNAHPRMHELRAEQLDLDKIVYNFASTGHPDTDSEGNDIMVPEYWKQLYALGEMEEGLTMLVLDVFGCPASSVDVERAFPFSRFTVSNCRYKLNSSTVVS